MLKVIEPGRAIFEMEADERHHNPMGTLHGGVYRIAPTAVMLDRKLEALVSASFE